MDRLHRWARISPLLVLVLTGCTSHSQGFALLPSANSLIAPAARLREDACPPQAVARELEKHVAEPYVVEPGDVLLVQPASLDSPLRLPGDQIVLPDGTIQLGRFGRLLVAGKTLEQLDAEVNAVIKARDADAGPVTVRLAARDSKVFYVLGEVNAPGAFPFRGRETVLDAILAAGGLNSHASRREILLSRPTGPCSCRVVLPVDYSAIAQLGDTTTNYQIKAGDRVFVPSRSTWEDLCLPIKEHFSKWCPPRCEGTEGGTTVYVGPAQP